MKIVIAGSRCFTDEVIVNSWIQSLISSLSFTDVSPLEIVTGGAKGVDEIAHSFAIEKRYQTKVFQADWTTHGKSAGPRRNTQMGDYADLLIAIWDGKSKGTKHMIDYMNSINKMSIVLTFPL